MSIRRALPSDAGSIRDVTRAAYAKWIPVIGREPKPMTVDYERAVAEHRIDLLFVGTMLEALIEMVMETDHLLIENLAVAPHAQARGHGRVLLDHAEHIAIGLGLPELRLYTNRQFAGNVEFYHRRGFAIDREAPFMGGVTVYLSKRVG